MAGGSPSTPFWSSNGLASLEDTQGEPITPIVAHEHPALIPRPAGAVPAALSSPWARSASLDTDSSLLAFQHSIQSARLTAAMSSQNPSTCCSPYHFPGGIAQRPQPQLRTTSAHHASSPIPITGRLQGPPTAPAYYGHRSTLSHGDLPAIEVSPDWLSAGAQPLMIGAPWRNHDGRTTHQDLEGGDPTLPTLATPESSTTAPLDIGPFEMDPMIPPTDPSSAAGAGASASTHETSGDLLPWGQTGAESYSQGAEQSLDPFAWLSKKPSSPSNLGSLLTMPLVSTGKYLTTLDGQLLATPASNHSLSS